MKKQTSPIAAAFAELFEALRWTNIKSAYVKELEKVRAEKAAAKARKR